MFGMIIADFRQIFNLFSKWASPALSPHGNVYKNDMTFGKMCGIIHSNVYEKEGFPL